VSWVESGRAGSCDPQLAMAFPLRKGLDQILRTQGVTWSDVGSLQLQMARVAQGEWLGYCHYPVSPAAWIGPRGGHGEVVRFWLLPQYLLIKCGFLGTIVYNNPRAFGFQIKMSVWGRGQCRLPMANPESGCELSLV
jgi:hypothetical protein